MRLQRTTVGVTTNLDGIGSDLVAGRGAGGLGRILTYGSLVGGAMMSPAPDQHGPSELAVKRPRRSDRRETTMHAL